MVEQWGSLILGSQCISLHSSVYKYLNLANASTAELYYYKLDNINYVNMLM